MKQWFCWLLALLLVLSLTGCGTAGNSSVREISSALSAAEEQIPESSASALESQPSSQPESAVEASPEAAGSGVLIAYFSWAENAVIEGEVENFSTNEKVFYPPQELDTSDTPLAEGGAGTLAYYAPWGDVVLFYDSFSANGSLYELGEAVSGAENIGQMSGTITVETVE